MNTNALIGQLLVVSERADQNNTQLENERNYICETMEKIQSNFGNQPAGGQMVTNLYYVINNLSAADSALNALRSRIASYIAELRG